MPLPDTDLDPLATPDLLADYTKGAVPVTDPRAERILAAASLAVRRIAGWHIAPVIDETMTLDGPGGTLLELPTMRVVEIRALTERLPGRFQAKSWTPEQIEALEWSAMGTIRRRDGAWTDRYRGITVELRHGYDQAPDIAQVVCQVAAMALSSPTGAVSEQAGGVSVQYGTTVSGVAGGMTLMARDLAAIDPYRIRRP